MPLSSMTGFARAQGQTDGLQWTWEIKSVNGKGLDVRMRLPQRFDSLEILARKIIGEHVVRGSVQLFLELKSTADNGGVQINRALLDQLLDLAHEYESAPIDRPRLDGLLRVHGVVEENEDSIADDMREKLEPVLLKGLKVALGGLVKARQAEGAQMRAVLSSLVDDIATQVQQAGLCDGARSDLIYTRFRDRLDAFLAETDLDQDRLAQEVALMAVKADVREELDRLLAHIESARQLLEADEPVGRKLDFLSQEFNREANTLCAKAVDVPLKNIGLALKATIDQFREQLQNIE